MYDNYAMNQLAKADCAGQLGGLQQQIQPPTIRENIARQIEHHQAAIARLEATMSRLEKSNLLDMKISDLAEAMRF